MTTHTKEFSCIYLFTIGFVKDLRESMKIADKYNDNDIVVKYGMTTNLLKKSEKYGTSFEKYGGNAKLKYYGWIDSEFQSKAERDIQIWMKYSLIKCDRIKKLAILTHEELKEVKDYFGQISNIYCGKLKNMIDAYKKSLVDKEKKIIRLKKDREMIERLLLRERESTKLLTKLLKK